jgi:hypothetical protein
MASMIENTDKTGISIKGMQYVEQYKGIEDGAVLEMGFPVKNTHTVLLLSMLMLFGAGVELFKNSLTIFKNNWSIRIFCKDDHMVISHRIDADASREACDEHSCTLNNIMTTLTPAACVQKTAQFTAMSGSTYTFHDKKCSFMEDTQFPITPKNLGLKPFDTASVFQTNDEYIYTIRGFGFEIEANLDMKGGDVVFRPEPYLGKYGEHHDHAHTVWSNFQKLFA